MRPVLALLALAAALLARPTAAEAQPASLALEHCRLIAANLPAVFANCGTLRVAENPRVPDGPQVELFVARVAALSAEPRADPLVLIAGGPGQSTVDMYLQLRSAFEPARRDRDIVLVDQRGTGRSATGFACDVPEDAGFETAAAEVVDRVAADCRAALAHEPRYFTTSVAVLDLEQVRAALGVERWNLYGVSYGTRVAQHYLRRFAEHTRSVVLDGVVPPDLALGPDVAREAQRALDQIFARCAADLNCGARFGALPEEFAALLARLDAAAELATAARPPLSGFELRMFVRLMSYSAATVALLPVLVHEAYSGNYAPLVAQTRSVLRELAETLSFPMSSSVTCTEDAPFVASGADAGLDATYLGTTIVAALRTLCAQWPAGELDADFRLPVVSDKPVLLLSGDTDPITPPAYAERVAAAGLANAKHVVGRGQGHGLVAVGCVPRVLRAFLDDPRPHTLDASCLEREPPMPFFLTLLGPSP